MLLLALKICYPLQVHLLRGNHEDEQVNALYGFKEECLRRWCAAACEAPQTTPRPHPRLQPRHPLPRHSPPPLRSTDGLGVWRHVNALFEMLPVAALVDHAVLCLHGGLGLSLHSLEQLKGLPRPAKARRLIPPTPQPSHTRQLSATDLRPRAPAPPDNCPTHLLLAPPLTPLSAIHLLQLLRPPACAHLSAR